jgi:hypothetical protein
MVTPIPYETTGQKMSRYAARAANYFHTHRKWIVDALILIGTILTYTLGESNKWTIIVGSALAVLGVNFVPNRQVGKVVGAVTAATKPGGVIR